MPSVGGVDVVRNHAVAEQAPHQQMVREAVHREHHLVSLPALLGAARDHAGVQHQHVDRLVSRGELVAKCGDRVEVGKIHSQHLDGGRAARARDLLADFGNAAAAGEQNACTAAREVGRDRLAEAAACARHERGAAVEAHAFVDAGETAAAAEQVVDSGQGRGTDAAVPDSRDRRIGRLVLLGALLAADAEARAVVREGLLDERGAETEVARPIDVAPVPILHLVREQRLHRALGLGGKLEPGTPRRCAAPRRAGLRAGRSTRRRRRTGLRARRARPASGRSCAASCAASAGRPRAHPRDRKRCRARARPCCRTSRWSRAGRDASAR